MRIAGAKVFDLQAGFVQRDLLIQNGRLADCCEEDTVVDAAGCYAIPGLTDLHFHGCVGEDFSDGTPEGLVKIAEYQLSRGITQFCPAGMTLAREQLVKICKVAAAHKKNAVSGADLVGVNLEGPFLSYAKRGARNPEWLQTPNLPQLEELAAASEGLVKLVSVAPEVEGAMAFIPGASKLATVSLAHTTADYDTAMAAFRAGARHVTHLFNAMPPFGHRDPGVVGAAADSGANVELICDGVHIHPAVVRSVFKLFGAEHVILISDTMRAAGMSDGDYTLGGQAVKVTGNRAVLEDGTIAGSVTDLMACMKTAVSFGIPLADAVRAAAYNPAKVLGIDDQVGTLEPGKQANVVLLDENLELRSVIFHGQVQ